jgi:hypothetical protein
MLDAAPNTLLLNSIGDVRTASVKQHNPVTVVLKMCLHLVKIREEDRTCPPSEQLVRDEHILLLRVHRSLWRQSALKMVNLQCFPRNDHTRFESAPIARNGSEQR